MSQRQYKQGIDRQQGYLLPPSVEEYVLEDNPVRAIDTYVESLDLEQMGFRNAEGEATAGQPAYAPAGLLKLYLYGYLHRLRSSRRLEAECQRNLEVIWLLEGLCPSYKTIADFRKANLKALKAVNQDFVQVCKELNLFGAELVGIDGSFFRGNVAKSRIYTAERLQRALDYVAKDIAKYLQALDQADQQEGTEPLAAGELAQKLVRLRQRQQKRKQQLQELQASGATQIAKVDPDARLLNKGTGVVAGYNVQMAIDAKHQLIVTAFASQDGNDTQQLAPMGQAAKAVLGVDQLTTVQDQGYFNALQIKTCLENGITPYVPEPDKQALSRQRGRFCHQDFHYEAQDNCYHCPAGKTLPYHQTRHKAGKTVLDYRSKPEICATCALKGQCLPTKMLYRTVTRWEEEDVLIAHRERMAKGGAKKMRQRCGLCEHPFGTLKDWCGWTHFLLRGVEKVGAELSSLMWSYNFKRVLQILGLSAFRKYCSTRRSWLAATNV